MADVDEDDEMTNCSVCFEIYDVTGDHVPRLLPCSHTLCEKCLSHLLPSNVLTCPECRIKHIADDGVMSFPQNKYIISHIRRSAKDQIGDVECCREHRKEASFYCKEVGCQKVICNTCLVKLHKFHDIVDIHEELNEQQELLENKVKTLKVILETKMAVALAAKAKAEESFNCSLRKINSRREEIIELFDQMKNDLTEKQKYQGVKNFTLVARMQKK